jgi:small-conductance mechanosensitive channel
MTNPWIEHVRKYAKDNNITYMCAITEAKESYQKVDKKAEKEKKENEMLNVIVKRFKKQYNEVKDDDTKFKFLKSNFNKKNENIKQYVKAKAPNLYEQLIFKNKE